MARRWLAPAVACGVAACLQDFDVFERGAGLVTDGGSDPPDATSPVDSGPVDAGLPDARDASVPCTEQGARQANGHCYFVLGSNMSWANASTACTNAGAHLVTVGSEAENMVVGALGSGDRWIGLRRPAGSAVGDGSFVWVTGEPRVFAGWANGEPNGSGECARLQNNDLWADASCTQSLRAICERE